MTSRLKVQTQAFDRAIPHHSLHSNQAGYLLGSSFTPNSSHLRAFARAETLSIPHWLDPSATQISDVIPQF